MKLAFLFINKLVFAGLPIFLGSCGSSPPSEPKGNGKRILHIVESEQGLQIKMDEEINRIIWQNFTVNRVKLSSKYDEDFLRKFYNTQKSTGRFRRDLSFEDYLKKKDNPLDQKSLDHITRLKLSKTPELVVTSSDGRVLDNFTGHHGDLEFENWIRQGIFSASRGVSQQDVDALLWSLDDESDRATLVDFLTHNAMSTQP